MSWESIVEGGESNEAPPAEPPASGTPDAPPPPPAPTDGSGVGELELEVPSLDLSQPATPPSAPPTPPAPTPSATAAPGTPAVDGGISFSIPDLFETTAVPEPETVTPVSPVEPFDVAEPAAELDRDPVPVVGSPAPIEPTPSAAPPAPRPEPEPVPVAEPAPTPEPDPTPEPVVIVEQTPVGTPTTQVAPEPDPPVPAPQPDPGPQAAPTTVTPAVAAPVIPASQPRHHPAQAASFEAAANRVPTISPLAVDIPSPQHRKSSASRGVVALLFTLLVVAALITAGIIYGRPYLFPEEWDEVTAPYAEAVEAVRGVEYVEPLVITAEAPDVYEARRSADLLGDWERELPVWRALGLANGTFDQGSLDQLLDGWNPAMYSLEDGQVYHSSSLTGDELDAHVTRAMAEAGLDQDFRWSAESSTRTLDEAALVEAHLLQQTRDIQLATEFSTDVSAPDATPLAFLPPVLGYRVVAPTMFGELLDPVGAGANPLDGPGGPGPLPSDSPQESVDPTLVDGETVVQPGRAMDRSFWYLAIASYVDSPTAYAASEAIVENSMTVVDRGGRDCTVATFSGGDINETEILRSALAGWVANAPAEFTASLEVLPDGTLQFASCDPGTGFENGARFGIARELIGWRLAELVVHANADGSSPDGLADTIDRIRTSGVGEQLASLPFDTTAEEAAAAAESAVAGLLGTSLSFGE